MKFDIKKKQNNKYDKKFDKGFGKRSDKNKGFDNKSKNSFQNNKKQSYQDKEDKEFYALTNDEQRHINDLNTRYRDRAKERLEGTTIQEEQDFSLPIFQEQENAIIKEEEQMKGFDIKQLKQEIQQMKQDQQQQKIEQPILQVKAKSLLAKNILNLLKSDQQISQAVKQNAYYEYDIVNNIQDSIPNVIFKRVDQSNVKIINTMNDRTIKYIDQYCERLESNYYNQIKINKIESDNDDIFMDAPKQIQQDQQDLQNQNDQQDLKLGKRKIFQDFQPQQQTNFDVENEMKIIKKSKLENMMEDVDDGYNECYPTTELGLDVMKEERNYQGKKTFAETFFTESNSQRRPYKQKQTNWTSEMGKIEKIMDQKRKQKQ